MSSVEPFDVEDGEKMKIDRKEKPNGEMKVSNWEILMSQWKRKKLNPTLLVIVPLIVLIEIAMNYNMLIIPPG
jgi:hypothetical protein